MAQNYWLNTPTRFGRITIFLHWLMALLLIGLFFLGEYMVDLNYYHPWYHDSLAIHKALGVIVAILLVLRVIWRLQQPRPLPVNPDTRLQNLAGHLAHILLYIAIFVLCITGYLISTAKEQGIDVFGWFEVPALLADNAQRGEWAGEIHEIVATAFIILVAIHTFAALFHHWYHKDDTLRRMLRSHNS